MQTVISTPTFLMQTKRYGLSEDEMSEIVTSISDNPLAGDLISGTGGARKLRHAGRNHGKSRGYRTIHYFGVMMYRFFAGDLWERYESEPDQIGM